MIAADPTMVIYTHSRTFVTDDGAFAIAETIHRGAGRYWAFTTSVYPKTPEAVVRVHKGEFSRSADEAEAWAACRASSQLLVDLVKQELAALRKAKEDAH